jgi:sugar phosphate isomerase/epimerase
MKLLFLCPQWGHEHLPLEAFFQKVKAAGYDGIETWVPAKKEERRTFFRLLQQYSLCFVGHQHQAEGNTMAVFCKSFEHHLQLTMECGPLFINSHSGRDYFTLEEQLQVIDTAENFSQKANIRVLHETHRGRLAWCPSNAMALFQNRKNMRINADFSHWVCVTESYLENYALILEEAICRSAHIHARVGHLEGPQVPYPALPQGRQAVDFFLSVWKRIIHHRQAAGDTKFTITPEFGPPPYMWTDSRNKPVADQWQQNLWMKNLLLKSVAEAGNKTVEQSIEK